MSLTHTLGWSNYPDEFNNTNIQKAFINSTTNKIYSSRNTTKTANPSKGLLKALYYILPTGNSIVDNIYDLSVPGTRTTHLQFEMSSSSGGPNYLPHYIYNEKNDTAELIHKCPGFQGKNLCYHANICLAVALLYIKPESCFSTEFNKLCNIIRSTPAGINPLTNMEFANQLVLTHDELYCDMRDNILPVNQGLELTVHDPSIRRTDGILIDIFNLKTSSLSLPTEMPANFKENMNQLRNLILNSDIFF